jgi:hypothetical protein
MMPTASIAELHDGGARFEMGEMPSFDMLNDFVRELERHEQADGADMVRRGLALSGARAVLPIATSRRGVSHLFHASAPRRRMMSEIAACFVAGLALLSSGQNRLGGPTPITATQTVAVASDTLIAGGPAVMPEVAFVRRTPAIQSRQDTRRFSRTRAARPATVMTTRSEPARSDSSRGRLDRLHLGWLRTKFIIRDDL